MVFIQTHLLYIEIVESNLEMKFKIKWKSICHLFINDKN